MCSQNNNNNKHNLASNIVGNIVTSLIGNMHMDIFTKIGIFPVYYTGNRLSWKLSRKIPVCHRTECQDTKLSHYWTAAYKKDWKHQA